jgi:hypothetical protein
MGNINDKTLAFMVSQQTKYTDYQIRVAVDKSVKTAHAKSQLDRHRVARNRFYVEIVSISMTVVLAFMLAAFVHFPDFAKIALDASPEGTRAALQRLKLL